MHGSNLILGHRINNNFAFPSLLSTHLIENIITESLSLTNESEFEMKRGCSNFNSTTTINLSNNSFLKKQNQFV